MNNVKFDANGSCLNKAYISKVDTKVNVALLHVFLEYKKLSKL